MARVALEIPKIGLVMENARLVRWLKSVGDTVAQGEPLLELETEKSVVEIEATVSGRLVEQLLRVDQEARVGDLACWLETDAAEPAAHAEERIRSTPVARRLATEHGVDLGTVAGTGPRGRVQLSDVQRVVESIRHPLPFPSPAGGRGVARSAGERAAHEPAVSNALQRMRRALARAMSLSNATVPQFAVQRAVDWTAIHNSRARLLAQLPAGTPALSLNDFLLQAIARALLSHPALNATFRGDPDSPDAAIVPARGANIGLVVAVENGVLVPVLHGVEQLGLAELARRRSELVDRALNGRLRQAELEGATFSLSNLGARGPDRFNAIISPPQSAILAVGRQRDCVVALNGMVEIRPMSELSLTVDHRVADGRLASEFLATLVDLLERNEWSVT